MEVFLPNGIKWDQFFFTLFDCIHNFEYPNCSSSSLVTNCHLKNNGGVISSTVRQLMVEYFPLAPSPEQQRRVDYLKRPPSMIN